MVLLISERFPLKVLQGKTSGQTTGRRFVTIMSTLGDGGGGRERRKQNILRTSCWVAVPFHPLAQPIRVRVCMCVRVCVCVCLFASV